MKLRWLHSGALCPSQKPWLKSSRGPEVTVMGSVNQGSQNVGWQPLVVARIIFSGVEQLGMEKLFHTHLPVTPL